MIHLENKRLYRKGEIRKSDKKREKKPKETSKRRVRTKRKKESREEQKKRLGFVTVHAKKRYKSAKLISYKSKQRVARDSDFFNREGPTSI